MDKGEEEKQGDEKEKQMKIDVKGKTVYLDGVPAFIMEGERKEPLTPAGWGAYRNNVRDVDYWLERRKRPAQSPSGQLG